MIMILEGSHDENKRVYLHFILSEIHHSLFQSLKANLNMATVFRFKINKI